MMSNTNILAELQAQLKISDKYVNELQSDIEDWKTAYDGFEEKIIELTNKNQQLIEDNDFFTANNGLLLTEIDNLKRENIVLKDLIGHG